MDRSAPFRPTHARIGVTLNHAIAALLVALALPAYGQQSAAVSAQAPPPENPIRFEEIAAKAGLHYVTATDSTENKNQPQTMVAGVALLDYDGDGYLDIYLVGGAAIPSLIKESPVYWNRLFHNNHDGTFTDVTLKAGLAGAGYGSGVAVGDYDNDGWPDIFLANVGGNQLFHNNGDGTFTDITAKAGLAGASLDGKKMWSVGAGWVDYNNDGKLDLFVVNYCKWEVNKDPVCYLKDGVRGFCHPRLYAPLHNTLYRNNGDGTFTDVSVKAGVDDKRRYYGFSSTFVDINDDGKVDLLVTDDSSPNYLYLNKGDSTFEDASFYSGFALNQDARETASMGLAVGDYANNGRLDLYTTTFSDDYKVLYRNDGGGNFVDITPGMGIAEGTYPFLSWGTQFFDYDNDGWKDLMFVSGHVYPQADQHNWGTSWAERALLFHNLNHGKKFEIMPAVEGTGLADVIPARGAAFGDLFNDGKIDVVINCMDHTPVLLRNVNDDHNHWVGLQLIGGPKSPRDAVGSTVYLTAGGQRQRGDVMSGGSFESSNDMRLHYGLGESKAVEKVEIRWPDGQKEALTLPGVDRYFAIEEGKGIVPSKYDAIATDRATAKASTTRGGK